MNDFGKIRELVQKPVLQAKDHANLHNALWSALKEDESYFEDAIRPYVQSFDLGVMRFVVDVNQLKETLVRLECLFGPDVNVHVALKHGEEIITIRASDLDATSIRIVGLSQDLTNVSEYKARPFGIEVDSIQYLPHLRTLQHTMLTHELLDEIEAHGIELHQVKLFKKWMDDSLAKRLTEVVQSTCLLSLTHVHIEGNVIEQIMSHFVNVEFSSICFSYGGRTSMLCGKPLATTTLTVFDYGRPQHMDDSYNSRWASIYVFEYLEQCQASLGALSFCTRDDGRQWNAFCRLCKQGKFQHLQILGMNNQDARLFAQSLLLDHLPSLHTILVGNQTFDLEGFQHWYDAWLQSIQSPVEYIDKYWRDDQ